MSSESDDHICEPRGEFDRNVTRMTAMEIAGKRHRAKGVERREKVPTESISRTPFPSASGYLIGWGQGFPTYSFSSLAEYHRLPLIQAFLTEIISSGYMGTLGLRFQAPRILHTVQTLPG